MDKKNFKYVVEFGVLEGDFYRLSKKFFRSRRKAIAFYNKMRLVFPESFIYCEFYNLSLCYSVLKVLVPWR